MQDRPDRNYLSKSQLTVYVVAILALAAVFSGYIVTGTYMRLSGDDYCYNAVERQHGFLDTQSYSYLHATVLGSNGFSLTFASSISSLTGTISSRILPGLVLVLWLVGGYLLVREVAKVAFDQLSSKGGIHPLKTLLIAGIIVFFTLYLSPNLGQSFYWRSGLLTYVMPLTFLTYMTAFFISVVRRRNQSWWTWITLFLLAFVGGGFSEAVTPMQLGLFSMVLVGAVAVSLIRRRGTAWMIKPLSAVIIGTLLALVIMVLSPVNQHRQLGLPPPPGFARLVAMSVENAFVFYKISLYKQLLPNILCGLAALAISYLFYTRQAQQNLQKSVGFPTIQVILATCGLILGGYLLIVCVMAPVAYGESSYPNMRTLIAPQWVMVTQIFSLGWLAGWTLSRVLVAQPRVSRMVNLIALLLILGVAVLAVTESKNIYVQIPRYQRWARYWDIRNEQIIQAKLEGQDAVKVMEIDHIIQDLSELKPDPFYWYNVCAAGAYGIERIYADQPGWDQ